MNKVIMTGRFTKDPEIRYSQGETSTCIARFSLAVDRRFKRDNEPSADFINCVAFGKTAEFIEKYMRKGNKAAVVGRIQTGSYTNRDGAKVYTTDVVIEEIEFGESKNSNNNSQNSNNNFENSNDVIPPVTPANADDFMTIPDGVDMKLPFN